MSWEWKLRNGLLTYMMTELPSQTALALSREAKKGEFGPEFLMDIITGRRKVKNIAEVRRKQIASAFMRWRLKNKKRI